MLKTLILTVLVGSATLLPLADWISSADQLQVTQTAP